MSLRRILTAIIATVLVATAIVHAQPGVVLSVPPSASTTPVPGWVLALHALGNELWTWFWMGLGTIVSAGLVSLYLKVSAWLGHKTTAEEEARARATAEDLVRSIREGSAAKRILVKGEAKAQLALTDLQAKFGGRLSDKTLETILHAAVERVPGEGSSK